MTVTLIVASSKGGVGKSTVAVHHAVSFAARGWPTLLIDTDPTATATRILLSGTPHPATGAAEAILGECLPAPVIAPNRPNLYVLPATPKLKDVDVLLSQKPGADTAITRLLSKATSALRYVVIDTAPVMGKRTLAALNAADALLIPVPCETEALAGLATVEAQLHELQELGLSRCRVLGYVPFNVDNRQAVAGEVREILRKRNASLLYAAEVRSSAAAKTLPAHGLTSFDGNHDPRGAADHGAVVDETLQRLKAFNLDGAS